jgi:hypothetical protein
MIGGNTKAMLQVCITTKSAIGEQIPTWHDVVELVGWLDLQAGDSKYTTFSAKIQESTHVLVCDYKPIPDTFEADGKIVRVSAENVRMVANSKRYDVMLIDNPMELNKQLEIYLKFTGGQ